ncbi:ATP synthase subunit 6 (mitochondrion) [Australozyma saopauloensis]|uniref:ATP synthase subunit a n=1 Tax=Australozyma saopauloensis TaxID=291208 RepID=A0AAX4HH14_9ASCO|nr:ATP synthase subunit 6 [[Candida] saopauloensis]
MFLSPLDQFEIKPIFSYSDTFMLSNYSIYLFIIFTIMWSFKYLLNNGSLAPNRFSLVIFSIYDTVLNMVKSQMGNQGGIYFPLMFTLFNFIIMANLVSMMPYSFAYSAQLVAIIFLSMMLWLGVTITGLAKHGWGFFALFVPTGTPLPLVPVLVMIELLSYSSRAMSLGLRLSANVLSGHLLMFMLGSLMLNLMSLSLVGFMGGFMPMAGVVMITMLEFAMSMIQGYVFCMLLCGYMKDALYLH